MATFKHLGSFGQPRDQSGVKHMASMAKATSDRRAGERDSALKSKALEADVASSQLKQQNKDREFGMDTVTQFSMKWNRMSEQEQGNFKTSDHYKNLQKLIKKTVPDMIDKEGDILTFSDKTMFKDRIDKSKMQLMEKVRNQQQLNPGEKKALDLMTRYRTDDISEVSSELEKQFESENWTDKQRAFELERRLKVRREARQNEYSTALSGSQSPSGQGQSLDFSNPNEWLDARGFGGGF